MTAIARTELAIMAYVSFFAACRDGHSTHMLRLSLLDGHKGSFLVPLPMAVVEEGGKLRLVELIRLCGFDHVSSLLAFKRTTKFDWSHYVGEKLPFLNYDFENGGVGGDRSTRGLKRTRSNEEVEVEVPGYEVFYVPGMRRATRSLYIKV